MLVCGFEDSVSRDAPFVRRRATSRTCDCFSVVIWREVAVALAWSDLFLSQVAIGG